MATYLEQKTPQPDFHPFTHFVYADKHHNQFGDNTDAGRNKIGSLLTLSYWETSTQARVSEDYFLPMHDMTAAEAADAVRRFAKVVAPDLHLPLVEDRATVEGVCNMLLGDLRTHMAAQHRTAQPAGV